MNTWLDANGTDTGVPVIRASNGSLLSFQLCSDLWGAMSAAERGRAVRNSARNSEMSRQLEEVQRRESARKRHPSLCWLVMP